MRLIYGTMRGMIGVELSPASALVRPWRLAMFSSDYVSGRLAGVLVGARRSSIDAWKPAIDSVTVESVVVHGVSLAIGPWADLIADGDIGWPLFGNARGGTLAVYVRNDAPELRELRVVVAMHGDDASARRGRLRR